LFGKLGDILPFIDIHSTVIWFIRSWIHE